jgi:hypothetical protein
MGPEPTAWSEITLSTLLEEVDQLFPSLEEPKLTIANYVLIRLPYGWKFSVVNSWQKWMDLDLKFEFGVYSEPEDAVFAFLRYVKTLPVDVRSLCEEP